MKILSFLNVSNLQRITCDSGYNFQRLVAYEFVRAGHKFVFVSPVSIDGLPNSHYKHISLSFGRHKYEVRFAFPWSEIEKAISTEEPDIVWLNQPELAPAFRALLNAINSPASLITYLHYFPYEICENTSNLLTDPSLNINNNSLLIPLAFFNGVIASDLILLHSSFAYSLLVKGLKNFSLVLPESLNIAIAPPPFDPFLIPSKTVSFEDRKSIIYNHRLYTQYGTQTFIDYLKRGLYVDNHTVLVMDILGERSRERRILDPSVEKFRAAFKSMPKIKLDQNGDNRNYYKDILSQAKFGVAPFRPSCPWSMSVIDCLAAGLPVIAKKQAFFPEIIPPECLHNGSYEELYFIWERLARDELFWQDCSDAGRNMVAHLTPENVTTHLCKLFNEIKSFGKDRHMLQRTLPICTFADD